MNITSRIDGLIIFLQEEGAVRSPAVEAALRRVHRHRFLEAYFRWTEDGWLQIAYDPNLPSEEALDLIYSNDDALVTRIAENMPSSAMSQARLVAGMLERLELEPGLKVLELGAGTGYNAALMAELVGDQALVVSVDIQAEVIAQTSRLLHNAGYPNLKLVAGDGFVGVAEEAPFDRIVATVGCTDLSPHWVDQLKPTGFMLIPLLHGLWHPLVKVWQDNEQLKGKMVGTSRFMPIQGELDRSGLWPNASLSDWVPSPAEEPKEVATIPGLDTTTLRDFYDFMACRDRRAFVDHAATHFGLYDKQSGIVAIDSQTGSTFLGGDSRLYDDLLQHYREWQELDRPQRTDYELEFFPLATEIPPLPERTWMIERKFYRELVTLP